MKVRVRFAPSPTGFLHIGTLRTAIFNWLFAKNQDGKFILRIEDTDLARSERGFEASIFEGLNWLGLVPDEGPIEGGDLGPYRQSERIESDVYNKYAKELITNGQAYYCFCSDQELDEERKIAESKKVAYVYSGKCKHLTPEAIAAKKAMGIPYTHRFSIQDQGQLVFTDLIKGRIEFDAKLFSDFVIIKSNGTPSYNFAVVVDDILMQITHVIRGEDHLSNTARQLPIFKALQANLPEFAHLPMILGPDRAKLSKRHGATSILEYKSMGYLPEAILNYLSLLGWSPPDEKEILSKEELIALFSINKINKANAIFDIAKLNWLNGQYIRKFLKEELFMQIKPFIKEIYLKSADSNKLAAMVYSVRDNLVLLNDINQYLEVYFLEDQDYFSKIRNFNFSPEDKIVINCFSEELNGLHGEITVNALTEIMERIKKITNFKNAQIFKPLRLICTGLSTGPHILECCEIMGKNLLRQRLDFFIKLNND